MNNFFSEIKITIRVDPRDINFVTKIIESHEGTAVVTTEDPKSGILSLRTSSSCADELFKILDTLPRDYTIIAN